MPDRFTRIADNVARVQERIEAAAVATGRNPRAVTLVAVTKYVGLPEIQALRAVGCRDLGESRPQALWQKAGASDLPDVRWHLVGHLQRNKVERTLPLVALIHSVDSRRLLDAIDTAAADGNRVVPVLLEVNVSGDAAKHGMTPDALRALLATTLTYKHVKIRGLMTMAARAGGPSVARKNFARLRKLRDELCSTCPQGTALTELSMGMTRDLEAAIAEDATFVRIGSALFEGLTTDST